MKYVRDFRGNFRIESRHNIPLSFFLTFFCILLVSTECHAGAKPDFTEPYFRWGEELFEKVRDFPNTDKFKYENKHIDLGVRYKSFEIFPRIWIKDLKWCAYVPQDLSQFITTIDGDTEFINNEGEKLEELGDRPMDWLTEPRVLRVAIANGEQNILDGPGMFQNQEDIKELKILVEKLKAAVDYCYDLTDEQVSKYGKSAGLSLTDQPTWEVFGYWFWVKFFLKILGFYSPVLFVVFLFWLGSRSKTASSPH